MFIRILSTLAVLFTIAFTGNAYAFAVPPNDGFVTDTVGILSQSEQENLESLLSQYRSETSTEIAVVILPSLQGEPLMESAVQIGREWGVGGKENDNGIVFLIAYEDRELFLAVGYGLEGAVPDIVAKGIIDAEITPFFKDGKYADGIEEGIMALQKHIGGEYTAQRYAGESDGMPTFLLVVFGMFLLIIFSVISEGILLELAPTRTWLMGGVMGFFFGLFFVDLTGSWLSIPFFVAYGLAFDFVVSYLYRVDERFARWVRRRKKRRRSSSGGRFSSGGGFGGGSSGGGFGGGSFGGGGARGRW
ncbi:hypothetical protein COV83_01730 [Candidatus Peregrinibacteria bacterium CG11_big_fil_rev_8_21_14_0_20_49_14]|nr:MAG: hypothetical protein COV83_01730 [Candidatus Peregrinibacteria bacterium CG11_big_fil_rev_8_21_14_0_20_49_14]